MGKPFPVGLSWALLMGPVLGLAAFVLPLLRFPWQIWFLVEAVTFVLEVVGVLVAIALLLRGGYRTGLNIGLTVWAAIPAAVVLMGAGTLLFGHWHM